MAAEFHVMSAKSVRGVQDEVTKRTNEGWELIEAYGMNGTFGEEHVLIFRLPKTQAALQDQRRSRPLPLVDARHHSI